MSKPFYPRLDDDEFIDEIRIQTVPRFKTSGLSGDEWRISVEVVVLRKGREIGRRSWGAFRYALPRLQTWIEDDLLCPVDDPDMASDLCMQPGCAEPATVEYVIVQRGCGSCGHTRPADTATDYRRKFCERHASRGNQSLDDSDRNYRAVGAAAPPREHVVQPEDESPAVFGGVIDLSDPDGGAS